MGRVRKFELEDIEQVIDLNIKSFVRSKDLSREVQYEIFKEVCFNNPWYNEEVRSLVYEDSNGKIKGFLGVVPRKFHFEGKDILIGVGQHLMVDKVPLASLQLFKEFFAGPQDLSITDMAVDVGRPLWERLGGETIYLHSIYWRKPLKPISFALLMTKPKLYNARVFLPIRSIFKIADYILSRPSFSQQKFGLNNFELKELEVNDFLINLNRFYEHKSLKPVYDSKSLLWLFERLKNEKRFGEFQKIVVLNKEGIVMGWFLYNLLKNGSSNVLQIVADDQTIETVINALFYHAWCKGAIELIGRLDPEFMRTFFDRRCFFMPGRNWMLAHSRRKEIIDALHSNRAFFTRLEGDLWFF
ncbi:MAG: hypothetical protein IGBAC_0330 [Ignavibacteriae bacterium]|nr:MAG: hypothetical protein IGBAC_0330 [Ignavibacteriota bacterium]